MKLLYLLWSNSNIDFFFFLGVEVKAEQLLEELDNGVLLCQLVGVLQNTIKECCSSNNLRVSHCDFFFNAYINFLIVNRSKKRLINNNVAYRWVNFVQKITYMSC